MRFLLKMVLDIRVSENACNFVTGTASEISQQGMLCGFIQSGLSLEFTDTTNH